MKTKLVTHDQKMLEDDVGVALEMLLLILY